MDDYDAHSIEQKWQSVWEDEQSFHVDDPQPGAEADPHFYMLEMLPYPSGSLHMGHVLNYTLGDVVTHFKRRHGFTVLRPMGFDSFGLPAENAAIKDGGHPLEITERNMEAIRVQMRRMGWAIDWQREVSAHEPTFYRWTQWLFLKFLEHGLIYRKEAPVNWCPFDQTVLANEHVVDGRCWRCGNIVEARNMAQWFFKITDYADELLADLAIIDWPARTKKIQTDWIGRSEGAEVLFRVEELDIDIPVFTTRPDTLFGATFFVVAPESPLVDVLAGDNEEVRSYARIAAARPDGGARAAREDGCLHRPSCDEPGERRADPDLRGRLRPDGVRHGRDHGGPRTRRARRRVRTGVRPAGRPGDRRRREADLLGPVQRAGRAGGKAGDRRVAVGAREGEAGDQLPPARLELLAAALLGRSDPGHPLPRTTASFRCPRTNCRCSCRRSTTTGRRASRRSPPTPSS